MDSDLGDREMRTILEEGSRPILLDEIAARKAPSRRNLIGALGAALGTVFIVAFLVVNSSRSTVAVDSGSVPSPPSINRPAQIKEDIGTSPTSSGGLAPAAGSLPEQESPTTVGAEPDPAQTTTTTAVTIPTTATTSNNSSVPSSRSPFPTTTQRVAPVSGPTTSQPAPPTTMVSTTAPPQRHVPRPTEPPTGNPAPEGSVALHWQLVPTSSVSGATLRVKIGWANCESTVSPVVTGVDFVSTGNAVVITLFAAKPPESAAVSCPAVPPALPYTIDLTESIGARWLFDGAQRGTAQWDPNAS